LFELPEILVLSLAENEILMRGGCAPSTLGALSHALFIPVHLTVNNVKIIRRKKFEICAAAAARVAFACAPRAREENSMSRPVILPLVRGIQINHAACDKQITQSC
jgi:hypothetical protein